MNINTTEMKPSSRLTAFYTLALTALLSMFFVNPAFAAKGVNADDSGYAIKGYDPVAYFTMNKAAVGNKQFTADYKGNKWAFLSEANKKTFLANPTAYLPQYGGYCAFAASRNAIAPVDPEAWTIHNKKLYLNFSKTVRETWSEDVDGNIVKSDQNWPELVKQVQ